MRGEIENKNRARQLRDFTGLRFGNITPTDIDGFVEFWDKLFVWIEAKVTGTELHYGQRLALERQCDAVAQTGRMAVVLVIDHDTPPEDDIDFATCPVRAYRYNKAWGEPREPITCKAAIDKLLEQADIPL